MPEGVGYGASMKRPKLKLNRKPDYPGPDEVVRAAERGLFKPRVPKPATLPLPSSKPKGKKG